LFSGVCDLLSIQFINQHEYSFTDVINVTLNRVSGFVVGDPPALSAIQFV
jgi:hypothetical protein